MPSARRPRSKHVDPYRLHYALGGLTTALFVCVGHWALHMPWLWAYLAGINLTTLLLYGHDKRQAIDGRLRVPEKVLHVHAFAGGTPGAYVAQRVFRHKTLKGSFRTLFWLIFAVQVMLVGLYLYLA